MNQNEVLQEQYANSDNLNKRINIHEKYSTNKLGFNNWQQQHYNICKNMNILEIGCGNGIIWDKHIDKITDSNHLYLTDFSEGMIDECKRKFNCNKNISFEVVNIEEIPYEDKSFDLVIANMMLYHVDNLQKGLSEVKRVLKDDAIFYCSTYGEHGITEFLAKVLKSLGVSDVLNRNFTLQNGQAILQDFFNDVKLDRYEDSLSITQIEDFLDYIYSMTGMTGLVPEDYFEVKRILEAHEEDGILKVPKEYGMFICK